MFGLLVQGGALLAGLAAGRVWMRVDQPVFHPDLVRNLLNGAVLYPLRLLMVWLGLSTLQIGFLPLGGIENVWLRGLLCFLMLDMGKYWLHFMHHRVPFFWSFHRVHHSVEVMDASAGLRMHAMDFVQLSLLPVLLFGVVFQTGFTQEQLTLMAVPGVVFDAFQHANLRFPLNTAWRRAWNRVFNNPLFHSWHHTRDGRVIDGNYGNVLTIWDRMFGTDVTRPEPPELYGISADQALEESVLGWWTLQPRKNKPI